MADRLPQYPMMPNFNAGLIQQQQQQQQLNQQQAQQQQDVIPGFPDQSRMWQQMPHMPLRPSGNDMNSTNTQMMDLLRSQNLARVQGQQQQQQLGQQQFSLGVPQMGNGAGGGPQQQQSFHDSSSSQQTQPHMTGAFPGAAGGIPNAPLQQSLNSRTAMLQAFQANQGSHPNPNVSRQLKLIDLAQNQQPQNGPVAFAARMEQQRHQQQQQAQQHQQQIQAMNQSSPGDMFPSPGMASSDRRPSPSHPNNHSANPMTGQQPQTQPQRRMTFAELKERATALRNNISVQEQEMAHLHSQRGTMTESVFMIKMRQHANELKSKKEYLNKVTMAMQGGIVGANMSAMAHTAQQQQGGGAGQASWMPQTAAPQSFENNGNAQMARAQLQNQQQQQQQQQQPQNGLQPSPSHLHAQAQANHLISQGIAPPPRSGPTPLQQHVGTGGGGPPGGGQFQNQMSPNMGPQQFPFSVNGSGGNVSSSLPAQPPTMMTMQMPPPLDKARFENAYKSFSASKGLKHEARLMSVEGRQIDLYALHACVMQEGGWNKVQHKELWSVIGGRMGFISIPATDTEPAKSAPGVAQHLAHVYKEYLVSFDMVYISSVVESRRKLQAAAAAAQAQSLAAAVAASGSGGPSQPLQQTANRGMLNPQQMQLVIGYANQSVAELRAQGVQEKIIQFVENNRANLQRTVLEQGFFRGQFQGQGQRGGPEQQSNGNLPNAGGPFVGPSAQQNAGLAGSIPAQRQQFMQQHPNGILPAQGNNFMNNQQQPQQPQQLHQQPQGGMGQVRPSKEQLHFALGLIAKIKKDFQSQNLPHLRNQDIPIDQRIDYNALIEQLHRHAQEIEPKLPMYYLILKSEEQIKKLIAIILTVNHQRTLLSSGNPRFIVSTEMLRNMMQQVQQAAEVFSSYLQSMSNRQNLQQQHPHQPPNPMPLNGHPPPDMPRPPIPQPLSQPQQLPPQAIPNRPPINLRPPPVMKKASAQNAQPQPPPSTATVSTPTPPPAYSTLTPAANAPTPTHAASSPQAPKSPKGKAPAKTKPAPKRRMSVKNAQPAAPVEQAQITASSSGTKRPREEETPVANTLGASPVASGSGLANEASPPKRAKTEWEGPPSEALKKKTEAVENIRTEEDASAFLEQMTELIKMAAGNEGQESLTSDISETLDMILKGYGAVPDGPESANGISSLGLGDLGEASLTQDSSSSSSSKNPADEFVEFFDFSSFGTQDEDDDGSKAPTPELLSSSSTNPSPESGSEADAAQQALLSSTDFKTDEVPDLLRLGNWKEIDGGESAYYQPGDWKWDSPMPTQEQPWAIFTS